MAWLILINIFAATSPAQAAAAGSVIVLGRDQFGQTTIPLEAQSGVVAIAAGDYHILALRGDGNVVSWGYTNYGLAPIPAAVQGGVVAIACGAYHSLVVKDDGSVIAWGDNWQGQTNVPAAARSGVIAVAAGDFQSLALKHDSSVVVWGAALAGSFNLDFGQGRTHPDAQTNVMAIASGRYHNLALKRDGRVVAWGWNGYGQTNVPSLAQTGVVAIAAANFHSVALRSDGRVVAWGAGSEGSPPDPNYNFGQATVPLAAQSGVVAIAAGAGHTVALKEDGSIISWGLNLTGNTNGTLISGGAIAVAAGSQNTVVLIGPPTAPQIITPPVSLTVELGNLARFTVKATGIPLTYQWRKDGANLSGATNSFLDLAVTQLSQAGNYTVVVSNSQGSVTSAPPAVLTVTEFPPVIVAGPVNQIVQVGRSVAFSVTATGSLLRYQWRKNGVDINGATGATFSLGLARTDHTGEYTVVVSNSLGSLTTSSTAVLTVNPVAPGSVFGWGENSFGQTTVPLAAQAGVTAIAGGNMHSLALKSDGSLVAWGNNDFGQSTVPVRAQTGVVAIAAGQFHSAALKSDGTIVGWGNQTNLPPIQSVVAIAAGASFTMALKNNGSVETWAGTNQLFQLTVPAAAQSGVVAIAASYYQSVALKADGTIVVWGTSPRPIPDAGKSGVIAIAAGAEHIAVLKANGSVVVWGGSDTNYDYSVVPAAAQSGVIAISAGADHTVALKSDGSIVAWGSDKYRQLDVPVNLRATSLMAGGFHTLALTVPSAPAITIPPESRSVDVGQPVRLSVTATGFPLNFQWQKNGVDINGATASTLTLGPARIDHAGQYSVVVSNPLGSVTSLPPAVVTVNPARPAAVIAWGWNGSGQAAVPAVAQAGFTAVSGGDMHTLALKSDGSVLAWGDNNLGQTNVPLAAQSGVTAVGAGQSISVALKSDGSVLTWGRVGPIPVAAQSGVSAIAAGRDFAVALKNDGSVHAWGLTNSGLLNVPGAAQSGVAAISAKYDHVMALKYDGSIVVWGLNQGGQLDVPQSARSGVIAIAAGFVHNLVLKSDGSVVGWGGGQFDYGQTNVPSGARSGVTGISAGAFHSVALKADGSIMAWGRNSYGESFVPADLRATHVEAGGGHTLALAVPIAPNITVAPAGRTVEAGQPAAFFVSASGYPLSFQWRKNGIDLPGRTTATLHFDSVRAEDAGDYTVVVSNSMGSVTSAPPAVLTVTVIPPTITLQPVSRTVEIGSSNIFRVTATGSQLRYQWRKDEVDIPSATNATYFIGNTQTTHSGSYTVLVSNSAGSVTSQPAVLTVTVFPAAITLQPVSRTVNEGQSASFYVTATGSSPLTYQWRKDGVEISGGTGATFNLGATRPDHAGEYTVVVSNPGGSATSSPAVLTVNAGSTASSGAIVAWGDNGFGQLRVPDAALGGVTAVVGGAYHAAALKTNGTVVAWGYNAFDQATVPPAAQAGVVAVTAGNFRTLALKNDGTVVEWGRAFDGNTLSPLTPPADLRNVTAIAAGEGHSVALKSDGSVVAWGWNRDGQATVPSSAQTGVKAIAAGYNHTVALKVNGTVVAWGWNRDGQVNVPLVAQSGVVAIAAGGFHSLALKSDGSVIGWGLNQNGQTTIPAAAQSGVVGIAVAGIHSVALKDDGSIVAWGSNSAGQTMVPQYARTGVIGIGAGDGFTMAIVRPTAPVITAPPANLSREVGQTAIFTVTATGYPLFYQWKKDGIDIPGAPSAPYPYSFLVTQLTQAGAYTVVVSNEMGSVTSAPPAILTVTAFPPVITAGPVSKTVKAGQSASFSVTATGSLLSYQWHKDGVAIAGATGATFNLGPARPEHAGAYTVVVTNVLGSVTIDSPAVLTVDSLAPGIVGAVAAWGNQNFANNGASIVPPAARGDVIAVAAGNSHSVALKVDGSVVAWGQNSYGQTSVPASAQSGVTAIAAGVNYTLALKSDGSVIAWGSSDYGTTEVPIAAQGGVTAIAAGNYHAVALKSDGSVVAWGSNNSGEIDVPDAARSGVTAIAAGLENTLALKGDGSVVSWGSLSFGEPAGLSGVVSIAAGLLNGAALKSDGSVVVWGMDDYNQTDVPLAARSGVVALSIASGDWYQQRLLALKEDGSLVAWGNPSVIAPAPAGLGKIIAIASGGSHTLAIVLPTVPEIVAQPANLIVAAGQNAHFSVRGTGYPMLYQWRKNGINIPGAVGAAYNLGPAQTSQAGEYDVIISNSLGSLTSSPPAILTVKPVAPGVVVAWGGNDYGQTDVPLAAQTDVIAVAAGETHSLALKSDGSLLAWGYNEIGQIEIPENARNGVAAIAAGGMASVALKTDGSVVIWGSRTFVPDSAQSNVTAIAAASYRTIALKSDGTAVAWYDGFEDRNVSVETASGDVAAVEVNNNEILFLKTDGSVVAWVYQEWGTLKIVRVPSDAIAIASGLNHSLALLSDGSVVGWGWNAYGQVDPPSAAKSGVIAIAAGDRFSMALKSDGQVVVWGENDYAQTNAPSYLGAVTAISGGSQHALAVAVPSAPTIVTAPVHQSVDEWHLATLTVSATGFPLFYQWFQDGVLVPGATNATYSIANAGVSQSGRYGVVVSNSLGSSSSLESPATLTVKPALPGAVVEWGLAYDGMTFNPAMTPAEARGGVAQIAAGSFHTAALKADGSVITWGRILNNAGAYEPATVPAGLTGVTALAAGENFTVALKSDGSLVSWGSVYNGSGLSAPNIYANAQSGIKSIVAGAQRAFAVKTDGTALSWGVVHNGRNWVPATQEAPAAALTGVKAIAVGQHHTLALKNDGTVVAWGVNWNGNSYVPATIPAGLTDVIAIAAGQSHSLAVKADGTVVAWGIIFSSASNGYVPASVPAGLQGVQAVAAGLYHSVALKNDGTVFAWGTVFDGVTYVPAVAPIGLRGVTAIAAGYYRTIGLLSDRPALLTRMSAEGLAVSWPSSESGYLLQSTPNLEPPVTWTDVQNLPTAVNGRYTFKPLTSDGGGFFRLRKP